MHCSVVCCPSDCDCKRWLTSQSTIDLDVCAHVGFDYSDILMNMMHFVYFSKMKLS